MKVKMILKTKVDVDDMKIQTNNREWRDLNVIICHSMLRILISCESWLVRYSKHRIRSIILFRNKIQTYDWNQFVRKKLSINKPIDHVHRPWRIIVERKKQNDSNENDAYPVFHNRIRATNMHEAIRIKEGCFYHSR